MKQFNPTSFPGVVCAFAGLWIGMCGTPAAASTIAYNLTGGAAVSTTYDTGDTASTQETVALTDGVTGAASVAGITLNVGDTIAGQINLSAPLTVPAGTSSNELLVLLQGTGSAANITFNESLNFYDNGVAVTPPAQWQAFGAAAGVLVLGAASSAATDPFTFNQLDFSATVTGMTDGSAASISSATLTAGAPSIEALGFSPVNPVPLPASVWLLLFGLGGVALLGRGRPTA